MEHLVFLVICIVFLFLFASPKKKSKRKSKKFGEGLLTDKPDSGNLNIWKY